MLNAWVALEGVNAAGDLDALSVCVAGEGFKDWEDWEGFKEKADWVFRRDWEDWRGVTGRSLGTPSASPLSGNLVTRR